MGVILSILPIMASVASPANQRALPLPFTLIGMGVESCAKAFNPTYADKTEDWILGFVSGMNAVKGSNVGRNTDAQGVIGEVRLICSQRPSMRMVEAAAEAYKKMAVYR